MSEKAKLQLKWGSYGRLPQTIAAADVGTIFVATDAQSIYLGAEQGKAPLQLSGVVRSYPTLESFQDAINIEAATPPYKFDSSVIYFIEDDQALMQWDSTPTEDYPYGHWVQLNTLKSDFDTLVGVVGELTSSMEALTGTEGIAKTIKALQDKDSAHDSAIETLQDQVAGSTNGLIKQVGDLNDTLKDYGTLKSTVETLANTDLVTQIDFNKFINSDHIPLSDTVDGILEQQEDDGEQIAANKADIEAINKALKDSYYTVDQVDQEFTDTWTEIEKELDKIDVTDRFEVVEDWVDANKTNIAAALTTIEKLSDTYATLDEFEDHVELYETLNGTVGNMNTDIRTNIKPKLGQIETNKANIEAIQNSMLTDDDKQELLNTITTNINAANCLHYKGSISISNDFNNINKATLKIGSTYIITADCTLKLDGTKDTSCHAGDLIIATGTEENGVITSSLGWVHVQSGYYKTHEPLLAPTIDSKNNFVKIDLTSLNGTGSTGDLGYAFIKPLDNLKVTSGTYTVGTGTNAKTYNCIDLSMEWGTF